nr:hypothetical protein 49 [Balneolaceae bacterium]
MPYNPSPKVRAAEKIGQDFGFDKVIIVGIDEDSDTYETISWGKDRRQCSAAKRLAGILYKAIYNYYQKLLTPDQ